MSRYGPRDGDFDEFFEPDASTGDHSPVPEPIDRCNLCGSDWTTCGCDPAQALAAWRAGIQ